MLKRFHLGFNDTLRSWFDSIGFTISIRFSIHLQIRRETMNLFCPYKTKCKGLSFLKNTLWLDRHSVWPGELRSRNRAPKRAKMPVFCRICWCLKATEELFLIIWRTMRVGGCDPALAGCLTSQAQMSQALNERMRSRDQRARYIF